MPTYMEHNQLSVSERSARLILPLFCLSRPVSKPLVIFYALVRAPHIHGVQLGGGGLEPSMEETFTGASPDGILAEAAHTTRAGEKGGRHVY